MIKAFVIIPAKGDSKRLVGKNKRIIADKTLIEHSIEYAKKSKLAATILVSTEDKETKSSAKEHVPCEFGGDSKTIAYNAQYLKEVVQHINNSETNIFLGGELTAAVFQPKKQKEKTELTSLLMPLRTQN